MKNYFLFYAVSNLGQNSFPTYQLTGCKLGAMSSLAKSPVILGSKCSHSR